MENCHAKDRDQPADKRNNDDANDNAHAAAADCGQDLARNDTGDGAIANHDNHIEDARQFRWPVPHEVPRNNLLDEIVSIASVRVYIVF